MQIFVGMGGYFSGFASGFNLSDFIFKDCYFIFKGVHFLRICPAFRNHVIDDKIKKPLSGIFDFFEFSI